MWTNHTISICCCCCRCCGFCCQDTRTSLTCVVHTSPHVGSRKRTAPGCQGYFTCDLIVEGLSAVRYFGFAYTWSPSAFDTATELWYALGHFKESGRNGRTWETWANFAWHCPRLLSDDPADWEDWSWNFKSWLAIFQPDSVDFLEGSEILEPRDRRCTLHECTSARWASSHTICWLICVQDLLDFWFARMEQEMVSELGVGWADVSHFQMPRDMCPFWQS